MSAALHEVLRVLPEEGLLVRRPRGVPPADHGGDRPGRAAPALGSPTAPFRYIRIYQLVDPNSWQAAGDVEHAHVLEALVDQDE